MVSSVNRLTRIKKRCIKKTDDNKKIIESGEDDMLYLKKDKLRRSTKNSNRYNYLLWSSLLLVLIIPLIFFITEHYYFQTKSSSHHAPPERLLLRSGLPCVDCTQPKITPNNNSVIANDKIVDLSIVLLTYNNTETALQSLLTSIVKQQTLFNFELVIADNGCMKETKDIIESVLQQQSSPSVSFPWKLVFFCENLGYAAGNNKALEHTNKDSKWVLFLNDDVELENDDFLQHMVNLGERKKDDGNAGAVGCKILNSDGSEVMEAGSVVWNDGSCYGYGRGRKDIHASDLMYTRPVDYVSGACLMVARDTLSESGGFDGDSFPAYYEDTDLQMRINYVHKKTIWFQPLAVLRHVEYGSFGSSRSAVELMQQGEKIFQNKWKTELTKYHLPYTETPTLQIYASRGPMRYASNILYIDQWIPDPKLGSGFGRAFDNVKILSELGYFVTSHAIHGLQDCDDNCMNEMQQDSIEIYRDHNLTKHLDERPGFYPIIIVSRPPIWQHSMNEIKNYCRGNNDNDNSSNNSEEKKCKIIYDAEALWFRRDELFLDAIDNKLVSNESIPKRDDISKTVVDFRRWEESLLNDPDAVVAVSEDEAKHMTSLIGNDRVANVHVVGHTMAINDMPMHHAFGDRNGILFLASFNGNMYYNGDAIFYFVKHIYPLVLKSAATADEPMIPLLIAGRNIPDELKELVHSVNSEYDLKSNNITILDSPDDIWPLYEKTRVFIAPHLYGSGIQYKLSEALSRGIPVVVSKISAVKMGLTSSEACIGDSIGSFATCVSSVHNDGEYWSSLQKGGLEYLARTHDRSLIARVWQDVISSVQ